MENKYILELAIQHGLDDTKISKILDVLYQMGIEDIGGEQSRKFVAYMMEHKMIEMPIEEILGHFKVKKQPSE